MATRKKSKKKYGKKASEKVERAMHEMKRGQLRSGRSGKKVTSRKQAVAIGLSEARSEGGKVPNPPKKKAKKTTSRGSAGKKKATSRGSTGKKSTKKTSRSGSSRKKTAGKKTSKRPAGGSSRKKSSKKTSSRSKKG